MIVMYDLDENILNIFDTYEECARYLDTSIDVLYSYISRTKRDSTIKKRDKKRKRWVKLYKISN